MKGYERHRIPHGMLYRDPPNPPKQSKSKWLLGGIAMGFVALGAVGIAIEGTILATRRLYRKMWH